VGAVVKEFVLEHVRGVEEDGVDGRMSVGSSFYTKRERERDVLVSAARHGSGSNSNMNNDNDNNSGIVLRHNAQSWNIGFCLCWLARMQTMTKDGTFSALGEIEIGGVDVDMDMGLDMQALQGASVRIRRKKPMPRSAGRSLADSSCTLYLVVLSQK
jgi:hypothetical protein